MPPVDVNEIDSVDDDTDFEITPEMRGDFTDESPAPVAEKASEPASEVPEVTSEAEPPAEPAPVADAEPPAEVSETVEAEAPAESESKPSHMVPKSRMDAEIAKRRALEKRLAEIERAKQAAAAVETEVGFDFEKAEESYMDAVLDGDKEKAKAIRAEIRQAERSAYVREAQSTASTVTEQTKAQLKFEDTVVRLQTDYPVFDPQSEVFDDALTQQALILRDGLIAQDYDPSDALTEAVQLVLARHHPELLQPQKAEVIPLPTKPTAQQVRKKVEAANQQPPKLGGDASTAAGASNPNLNDLSEEEFDALPESVLKKLRGDFV